MRVVSQEEQQKYLAAAHSLLRDVATCMVETGMRPEEVYTIRKENVHLDRRYLFVPSGKTRFARRNVPLTATTLEILKRSSRKPKELTCSRTGEIRTDPLPRCIKRITTPWGERRSAQPFRLYDLRHTFGSRSAMAGVDLSTLKERMGHSAISPTMRYVHPTPEHKLEAVKKLEAYNTEQMFVLYDGPVGYPTKVPTVKGTMNASVHKLLKVWWALGDDFRTLPMSQIVANLPRFDQFDLG